MSAYIDDETKRVVHPVRAHRAFLDTGLKYEEILNEGLEKHGLAFWTEDALRSKGFFKTPDAKLQVLLCPNCLIPSLDLNQMQTQSFPMRSLSDFLPLIWADDGCGLLVLIY